MSLIVSFGFAGAIFRILTVAVARVVEIHVAKISVSSLKFLLPSNFPSFDDSLGLTAARTAERKIKPSYISLVLIYIYIYICSIRG